MALLHRMRKNTKVLILSLLICTLLTSLYHFSTRNGTSQIKSLLTFETIADGTPVTTTTTSTENKKSSIITEKKCFQYFDHLFKVNKDWDLSNTRVLHNDDTDDEVLKEMMETTRMYFDCSSYFDSELDETKNSLSRKLQINYPDLESRVFPFLNPSIFSTTNSFNKDKSGDIDDVTQGSEPNDDYNHVPYIKKYVFNKDTVQENNVVGVGVGVGVGEAQVQKILFPDARKTWTTGGSTYAGKTYKGTTLKSLLSSPSYSQGKGIVLTLGEKHLDILPRFLQAISYLETELTIQIVLKDLDTEFSNPIAKMKLFNQLNVFFKNGETFNTSNKSKKLNSNLNIEILDCSPLLKPSFISEGFINVLNKWITMVFNTFEEFILLDIDVVLFEKPEFFFQMEEYLDDDTNMVIFKDRDLVKDRTFPYCIEMFSKLLPPTENSGTDLDKNKDNDTKNNKKKYQNLKLAQTNPELNNIYERFFNEHIVHHIDSGVVIGKKLNALPQLLTSMQLNLGGKPVRCVYGDKEFTWIGFVLTPGLNSNENIENANYKSLHIVPYNGGIAGRRSLPQKINDKNMVEVCGTQLAHVNPHTNKLLWVNGGLQTCKLGKVAAFKDFNKDYDYFASAYGTKGDSSGNGESDQKPKLTLQELEDIYERPLYIDTVVVPHSTDTLEKWYQKQDCDEYFYCVVANIDNSVNTSPVEISIDNSKVNTGENLFIDLTKDKESLEFVNDVSKQWNLDFT